MDRMRRATGPDYDFVLDGGGKLVAGDAQTVAAELEKFHLLWFDEPTKVSNLGAIKKISGESVTPLGFGRTLAGSGDFQDLLREDAVDILRPSLAVHGISMIRRIAALAETYYVAVAPHHDGGPVGTAAALHLAASIPNFFIQHVPSPEAGEDRDMRRAIAGEIEKSSLGFAALPTGPGLGISVDEAALGRYEERA
jgi:galactonate dehydratase